MYTILILGFLFMIYTGYHNIKEYKELAAKGEIEYEGWLRTPFREVGKSFGGSGGWVDFYSQYFVVSFVIYCIVALALIIIYLP